MVANIATAANTTASSRARPTVPKIPGIDAETKSTISATKNGVKTGSSNPCNNPTFEPGDDPAHNLLTDFSRGASEGFELGESIAEKWSSGTPRMIYVLNNIRITETPECPQTAPAGQPGCELDVRVSKIDLHVEQVRARLGKDLRESDRPLEVVTRPRVGPAASRRSKR